MYVYSTTTGVRKSTRSRSPPQRYRRSPPETARATAKATRTPAAAVVTVSSSSSPSPNRRGRGRPRKVEEQVENENNAAVAELSRDDADAGDMQGVGDDDVGEVEGEDEDMEEGGNTVQELEVFPKSSDEETLNCRVSCKI